MNRRCEMQKKYRSIIFIIIGIILFPFCMHYAYAKETVKIAFIAPLSGGVSAIGTGGRNSADLAIRLHNKDPQSRYKYELVELNDACDPETGIKAAEKAGKDHTIVACVAHYCSSVALETVHTYHKYNLPAVIWGAVNPDITYGNNYNEIFRVNGTMLHQSETASKFMIRQGFQTWVILHETTSYGLAHKKFISLFLKRFNGKVMDTMGLDIHQENFVKEIKIIQDLKPDVIFYGGLTPLGIRFCKALEKAGVAIPVQGTSGIVSRDFIDGVGEYAEGIVAFREGAPIKGLPGGERFMELYRKQGYKEPPEAYGPFAFAATELVCVTVEKAGPDRNAIRDSLRQVRGYESIIGMITFDEHGQNRVPMITKYVVQDGKWVDWESSEYRTGKRTLKRK